MVELSELTRGVCLMFCVTIAAAAWCGGVWSVWRGYECLPDGATDLPFLSGDPRRITAEGRVWRRRIYVCIAWFVLAVMFAVAFRRM